MALIKCYECGKDISTQAAACPHCGYPVATITTESALPAAQQTTSTPPNQLNKKEGAYESTELNSAQPTTVPAAVGNQPSKGCGGCIGIGVAIFVILTIIGMFVPETQTDESWKAGYHVGLLEGNVAYNGGSRHASSAALDAAARRITASVSFDSSDKRDAWMRGFKAGYEAGWNKN